jgi:hypothetical protein
MNYSNEDVYPIVFRIDDFVTPFELDRTKIDVYIEHHFIEVDAGGSGKEKDTTTRIEIRECNEEDANKTEY